MNDETDRYHALHNYKLFITPEHECSYLEQHISQTLFVDPHADLSTEHYSLFSEIGFRRSGEHVYRPHCPSCQQCKAMRITVDRFKPNRSQRRCLTLNREVQMQWVGCEFRASHFELYQRYMKQRHSGSSMADDDPERYLRMMQSDWCDTRLAEFTLHGKLVAVAITDWLDNGLSAVYTYFDPQMRQHSLGTYAILQQIATAQRSARDFMYLGYWIRDCAKMSYKRQFSASSIYQDHSWQELDND